MAVGAPATAPVLSTPDINILENADEASLSDTGSTLTDEQLWRLFEIQRTVDEVWQNGWRRIALQFPDDLLVDAPRVYAALSASLQAKSRDNIVLESHGTGKGQDCIAKTSEGPVDNLAAKLGATTLAETRQVYILGDTSYGACCVDEIAAEHVNADGVVHYGRSCLSPTARLPVIYVFTRRDLDFDAAAAAFKDAYPDVETKVLLMADTPYSHNMPDLLNMLQGFGYSKLDSLEIKHDPNSLIPNRSMPSFITSEDDLRQYHIFHVSEPPESLLLTLSSKLKSFRIFPCRARPVSPRTSILSSSDAKLRRRYALVTNLSSCSVFGILINTLSVKNYLHVADHVRRSISEAGKKAYTFVVGKINPAKIANFSEIEGWVVIGCWESSLIESKEFWKPIITPFELELALQDDSSRVWTGEWTSDFQAVLQKSNSNNTQKDGVGRNGGSVSDLELPEYSLRTGKFVSQPWKNNFSSMAEPKDTTDADGNEKDHQSLIKKTDGSVARIGGEISPGATFLRNNRTWQGLGSDFELSYDNDCDDNKPSVNIQEGSSGIARGYSREKSNT